VKLSNALITQAGDELRIAALGTEGVGWDGDFQPENLAATRTWLKQKSLTIAGGTMEVQKNIIAKRVLGTTGLMIWRGRLLDLGLQTLNDPCGVAINWPTVSESIM
jgi:hypothetical protein